MNSPICCGLKPASKQMATGMVVNDHRADPAQQNQHDDAEHHQKAQGRDHVVCLVLFL